MLNLSADTTGDIHLWVHGDTRLANLTVVVHPSCVDSSTAGTYLTMKLLGKLEEHVETLFGADTISAGYDNRRSLEVVLGSLDVAVDDFHGIRQRVDVILGVFVDDLTFCLALVERLLHDTAAHVAICGKWSGLMMVATMLPPKAGRIAWSLLS